MGQEFVALTIKNWNQVLASFKQWEVLLTSDARLALA